MSPAARVSPEGEGPDLGVPGVTGSSLIGRGGFGAVYRARQVDYDRTVAVKLLIHRPDPDSDEEMRFERESKAMGRLSGHPSVVTVYESGHTDDGRTYLVMEYLPGGNLAERIAAHGPLPWDEVADIGVKLAAALDMAHRNGILHRDVKPENILVSAFGEPKLADFGIARVTGGPETTSGQVMASLQHAAPEVFAGETPTEASDVYALGSTLFHLLAGSSPFAVDGADTLPALVERVACGRVPDLTAAGIPPALFAVVKQALAKDPAHRPASAEEFARRLQRAQVELGCSPTAFTAETGAGRTRVGPDPVAAGAQTTTVEDLPVILEESPPTGSDPARQRSRASVHPLATGAVGVGLAVAAIVVVVVLLGRGGTSVPGDAAGAASADDSSAEAARPPCPPPLEAMGPRSQDRRGPGPGLVQASCDLYRSSLAVSDLEGDWSQSAPLYLQPESGSGLCSKGSAFGLVELGGQAFVAYSDNDSPTRLFERVLRLGIGADTYLDDILTDATTCESFRLDVAGIGPLTMTATESDAPEDEDSVWMDLSGTTDGGLRYQGLYAVTRVEDDFVAVVVLGDDSLDWDVADALVTVAVDTARDYDPSPSPQDGRPPESRQVLPSVTDTHGQARGTPCDMVAVEAVAGVLGNAVIPNPSAASCTYQPGDLGSGGGYGASVTVIAGGRAAYEGAVGVHSDSVKVTGLGDDAFYSAQHATVGVLAGETFVSMVVFGAGTAYLPSGQDPQIEPKAEALAEMFLAASVGRQER